MFIKTIFIAMIALKPIRFTSLSLVAQHPASSTLDRPTAP